ncbi:MAG: hypothetical protein IKM06_01160 [Clostridia bacterium]|nr:hypothetical protein [Clostridia bacterium]
MRNIGNDRELFIDSLLIDENNTDALKKLHRPEAKDAVFTFDAPWENNGTVYHNIIRRPDGRYFMYYKANSSDVDENGSKRNLRHICVLESDDGLTWKRPVLNINPIFKNSNIITVSFTYDNFFVFYDTNPECPDNERYKAIIGEWNNGLYADVSPDGINFRFHQWSSSCEENERKARGVLMFKSETNCHFDTLNTIYYRDGLYHAYVRGLHRGDDFQPEVVTDDDHSIIRDIRHTVSKDFWHWSAPVPLTYDDKFDYELYTNGITPYYRSPRFFTGIPTRYVVREEWSPSFDHLPNSEDRRTRSRGLSITDALFMASRNGTHFTRYNEPFITPGAEHFDNWIYGDCYVAVGMTESPALIPGQDPLLSIFVPQKVNGVSVLFRHTVRVDGFVSYYSGLAPHTVTTKPVVFKGSSLEINFATSALGKINITVSCGDKEIHSADIFGDKIDRTVDFIDGALADFSGKECTITFTLSDAELYSYKFN